MLIKNIVTFVKHKRILEEAYNMERIIPNLSNLFEANFKKDKACRLYCVINPHVQNMEDTVYNSKQVYEITADGKLSDVMYVEKWVMDKLNIASMFIRTNNLFDLVTYDIKRIDENDNYLFVIEPISFKAMIRSIKRFFKGVCIAGAALLLAWIAYAIFF